MGDNELLPSIHRWPESPRDSGSGSLPCSFGDAAWRICGGRSLFRRLRFVITRVIAREIHEKQFSIPNFLVRRARRLLPAAAACFVVTLLISYFVLLPVAFQTLGESLSATVLMYSNYFYYHISSYFSPQAFEVPLLHTWSLAIEDQFYLTWPAILMVIMPRRRSRPEAARPSPPAERGEGNR